MGLAGKTAPKLFAPAHLLAAVAVHLLLFGLLWVCGILRPEDAVAEEEEEAIECLVVVHENLDGEEDEPPPEREVTPSPPDPEPEPEPPPPEPEPVEEDPVVIPEDPPKPDPPKPKPDPPKPPKPTREEQMARIRNATTVVTPPRFNGRTEERPDDWRKLLAAGATSSNRNQGLDANEEQLCKGLIKKAFHDKWQPRPAWTADLRKMTLSVTFDGQGRVTAYRLVGSSGDPAADQTVLNAAKRVGRVSGLTAEFLKRHPTNTITFEVEPL